MPPKCAAVLVLSLFSFVCSANAQQASSDKYTPALDITAMDRSIDPCVDFFAYACGGWIKSNPIPPDQSSWDLYSKMEDENKTKLRGILEAASTPDAGRNAVNQKIGDYYASCMDEKAIEDKGIEPLKPGLDRIAKISSKSELADAASAMTTDNVMFRFESIQDFRDANQFVANADQGGLGLPDRDYYLKTMPSRRNCGKRTSPTCRRCFSFSATVRNGRSRGANGDAHRDGAGEGLDDARRAARSQEPRSQADQRRAGEDCSGVPLAGLLHQSRAAVASRH